MRVQLPAVVLSFAAFAYAQITDGLSFDGGDVVSLLWGLDSETPSSYDFYLCAGDETTDSYDSLSQVIKNGTYSSGDVVSFRVDQSVGGNELNAYFLKVVSTDSQEYWSGFTSHFTLRNMKGSFSPKVLEAIKTLKPNPPVAIPWPVVQDDHLLEDDVPSTFNISRLSLPSTGTLLQFPTPTVDSDAGHNELRKRQVMAIGGVGAGAAAAAVVDQHTVPFGEQTGLTKYAPMPKSAGTTIATRSATPQYPPFPYSIATAYLGAPTVQYTDMAYATWTAQSIENTAAPAPQPTLDKRMQKWLDRWKD
ncbi:hypothetical protein N7499_011408 [Penicillium canescens]|uniref:Yeast cell wall synthesis Kre9/Knh1 C-terminal domain-containing protein n=1 Tax=Penicillium canescens TaxID=5083 RepID=A0AAD6IK29_PENCN|nr:uncharacterized protein N7446_006662 [Penicillium canescens]KAJ5990860.1 hypothetical protein N7522_011067 [Penicillium canescens]KAJ6052023.1 hypothetical protein N7460_002557 [Penicillium canescens]KAJ6062542.1 hypothetical protein N7446_006662 [Penicillium canescens]KAJ6069521.1 hypothetical protein N7499_011408 [Penicillium canescens]KAJ6182427.1 hypothetical protein N7485_001069 [Penicillium canescens]